MRRRRSRRRNRRVRRRRRRAEIRESLRLPWRSGTQVAAAISFRCAAGARRGIGVPPMFSFFGRTVGAPPKCMLLQRRSTERDGRTRNMGGTPYLYTQVAPWAGRPVGSGTWARRPCHAGHGLHTELNQTLASRPMVRGGTGVPPVGLKWHRRPARGFEVARASRPWVWSGWASRPCLSWVYQWRPAQVQRNMARVVYIGMAGRPCDFKPRVGCPLVSTRWRP